MGTRAERRDMDVPVRLRLLEGDMDTMEAVGERLAGRVDALSERVTDRLSGLAKIGIGILSALVAASLLLAVNLIVAGGVPS